MFVQQRKPSGQEAGEDVIDKQTVNTSAPFLPVVALADQVKELENRIFDMVEFVKHQPCDNWYRKAAIIFGKRNIRLIYDADGVLV